MLVCVCLRPRSLSSTLSLEPYFLSMRDSSVGGSALSGTLVVCNGYRIPTRGLSQAPGRWRYPGPDSPRIYASTVEAPPAPGRPPTGSDQTHLSPRTTQGSSTENPRAPGSSRDPAQRTPGPQDHREAEVPQDPGASPDSTNPRAEAQGTTEDPRLPEEQRHFRERTMPREGRKGHWTRAENGRHGKRKPKVRK